MKNNEKNFIGDINKELEEIEKLDILEEIEESLLTMLGSVNSLFCSH